MVSRWPRCPAPPASFCIPHALAACAKLTSHRRPLHLPGCCVSCTCIGTLSFLSRSPREPPFCTLGAGFWFCLVLGGSAVSFDIQPPLGAPPPHSPPPSGSWRFARVGSVLFRVKTRAPFRFQSSLSGGLPLGPPVRGSPGVLHSGPPPAPSRAPRRSASRTPPRGIPSSLIAFAGDSSPDLSPDLSMLALCPGKLRGRGRVLPFSKEPGASQRPRPAPLGFPLRGPDSIPRRHWHLFCPEPRQPAPRLSSQPTSDTELSRELCRGGSAGGARPVPQAACQQEERERPPVGQQPGQLAFHAEL